MIVVMAPGGGEEHRRAVVARIAQLGLRGEIVEGEQRTVVAVLGDVFPELRDELLTMDGVDQVLRVSRPFKLASREVREDDTVVELPHGVRVGAGRPVIVAGPCAIETEEQLRETAREVRAAGAHALRGGAFKPRTSPYSFQGLGVEALRLLREAGDEFGMPVVTELLSERDVDAVARYADVLQIGARNMQNFVLLSEAGRTGKPVLLKRGFAATVEEWLLSAEYVLTQGNPAVMLCERGVRTFETATRGTLDLNAVALVKRLSHLPVLVDPSHGAGQWELVRPLAAAGLAAGADGVMVEVHVHPDQALSGGMQSLTPARFGDLARDAARLAEALGRPLAPLPGADPLPAPARS